MAINILPTYDPGQQVGEGLGQGFGSALQMLGQREQQRTALESLKGMDFSGDPLTNLVNIKRATAGIPGLENFADVAAPYIMARRQTQVGLGQPGQGQQQKPAQQQGQPSPEGQPAQQEGQAPQEGQIPAVAASQAHKYVPWEEFRNSERAQQLANAGYTLDQIKGEWDLANSDFKQQEAAKQAGTQKQILENQIFDQNYNSWAGENGLASGGDSQFFRDIGNSWYREENQKNPEQYDENWKRAKDRMNQFRIKFQDGESRLQKPWLHGDEWLKSGTDWSNSIKKIAGDTPEVREKLMTKFIEGGADRDYAREMVTPASEDVKKYLKNIPSAQTIGSEYVRKQEQEKFDNWLQPFVTAGKNGFSILDPNESLMLFRNNMYRQGNLSVEQANDAMRKIIDAGGVSKRQMDEWESQSAEVPSRYLLVDIMR